MICIDDIYTIYTDVYRDITQNEYIKLKKSESNDKLALSFIKQVELYKPEADLSFFSAVIRYNISYRLERYKAFGGKIMPSWILGKKAIEYYMGAHLYKKEKVRLKGQRIKNEKKSKSIRTSLPSEIEENYKNKFYNTKYALYFCIDTTTLYHPYSKLCADCPMKDKCIETQKEIYPLIYKNRKNGI